MAGIWCPEIRTLQAEYKPATDRVLGWIKNVSNVRNASVNRHVTLADQLVRNGIQMPEDILQDLYKGIDRRQQAEDALAKHGGADHGHSHMIKTLQQILHLFCPPSRPTTPEPVVQQPAVALPSVPSPQGCVRPPSPGEGWGYPVQQRPPPPPPVFYPGVHPSYGNPMPSFVQFVAQPENGHQDDPWGFYW
ncbi:hypothetical protein LTR99_005905 [Exophiala xenobiotica]|uniref:DUF6604 domain-containing protein n=1 Tax=Vermiconidia calcicola TaxID=1690605 RepID=A0AAV9QEQ0_9PEZI|nr:hypothetical protein H2202_000221 [Exophiala xenobiotica]KAK5541021.1 hypothetical protein LTR25_002798 [Vermiconidia calcicola]KAK5549486.1 hypothetical protein LTR23_000594 [Chaetothyriales sp. CCFEE 6169]KAK5193864.1 hypothetical protein LTR92_006204 [Exophiala xenobiotica]KAK5208108.1 hypothetical protein LTR41_006044 [Exophiala xenobiotica]